MERIPHGCRVTARSATAARPGRNTVARYLDSSGVRALFTAYRAFRIRKLRLSLGGATATVKKVLDIVDAVN